MAHSLSARQDGRISVKSKEEVKDYFDRLGIKKGRNFTATLPDALLSKLNQRERQILDVHYALMKAPCWLYIIFKNI